MSESEALGGDFRGALENVTVPSYVIDTAGVIRWVNPAAIELFGDVRGRHYTSVVAPEETRRAREVFTRKIVGAVSATETEGVLLKADGTRVALELCAVPLRNGDRIVGVFGQLVGELEEPPGRHTRTSPLGRPRCSDCSNMDARPGRSPTSSI